MSEGDGSAVAWGSPFAGGDTSEVAQELAQDVEDTTGFSNSFSNRFFFPLERTSQRTSWLSQR